MLEIHCAAAVKSSPESNGLGSMYIQQGRHSHGNTAHFTNCFFITWLTEINPNQTYYPFPSWAPVCLGSLKWNKSVRLTRQRASCQSAVPLSERRGTVIIVKNRPALEQLWFSHKTQMRDRSHHSHIPDCRHATTPQSARVGDGERIYILLFALFPFQDSFLQSDAKPDATGFQLWLQLFWPSHDIFLFKKKQISKD